MGAELVQQRDVLARMKSEIFQQPGNEPVIGRRASEVGKRDNNFVGWLDPLPKRPGADGIGKGSHDRAFFVRQGGTMGWSDHGRAIVGQINGNVAASVCEIYFHCVRNRKRNSASGKGVCHRGFTRLSFQVSKP